MWISLENSHFASNYPPIMERDAKIAELEKDNETLKGYIRELHTQISNLVDDIAKQAAEIAELKKKEVELEEVFTYIRQAPEAMVGKTYAQMILDILKERAAEIERLKAKLAQHESVWQVIKRKIKFALRRSTR